MKHVSVRGRVHVASGPYAYILISTHSPVFNSLDLDIIPFLLREKKEHSRNVPALSNSTIETQFRHRDGNFCIHIPLGRPAMRCWLTSQSSL